MRIAISYFVNSFFATWSRDHPEEKLAGLGGVVSSTYPRPEGSRPVTRVSRSVAVGYNDINQIVRIKWFDHVRL